MRLASIVFPSLPCALAMCVQSVVRSRFVLSFGESVVATLSSGPFVRQGFVILNVDESLLCPDRGCTTPYPRAGVIIP